MESDAFKEAALSSRPYLIHLVLDLREIRDRGIARQRDAGEFTRQREDFFGPGSGHTLRIGDDILCDTFRDIHRQHG